MRIAPEKIDEVRTASDIVEVISSYVQLRKRGSTYWGLCPFHSEKTPSFSVSPSKQLYYCFGCHKGGNVVTFVQEIEKLQFADAIKLLAERAGIRLIETADSRERDEFDRLFEACRIAGKFFYESLTTTAEGKAALEYLHARKITDESIRAFGLGYAPNSWDGLIQRAARDGISTDTLLKAGLVRLNEEKNRYYDYFRGRLMFPVFTHDGKVIAFGARKLREDDAIQGKYINSPDSAVYSKSRSLFCLFQAKEAIRTADAVILVEGYLDAISLFQSGVQNVVASSGTALTPEQLQLIARYTRNLVLLYDADSAGSAAAVRGIDLALERNIDVRIAQLPQGEDPDTFVQKAGAPGVRKLVEEAVSFIEFKSNQLMLAGAFSTPEKKAESVRAIVQSIAKIADPLRRAFFVKEVAQKFQLYETDLNRELDRWLSPESRGTRAGANSRRIPVKTQPLPETPPSRKAANFHDERELLQLLFEADDDLRSFIFSQVSVDLIEHPVLHSLFIAVLTEWEEHGRFAADTFISRLEDPELVSAATELTVGKYELSKLWEKNIEEPDSFARARGAILGLRLKQVQRQIDENLKELNEASLSGKDKLPFMSRHKELLERQRKLKEGYEL